MEVLSAFVPLVIKIGIDPQIAKIGGLEIAWHGVFTAVGVICGVGVATFFGRKAGFGEDTIYNTALALVIGGIVGARALYVLENHSQFEHDLLDVFAINAGGISIYGALIGGTLAALGYAAWRRLPRRLAMADVAAMGAIIGMAVGRIGDIINGEHFAKTTDWPIGVLYTHSNSPSYPRFTAVEPPLAQHPVVAYELVGDLLIFAALFVLYRLLKRDGMVFWAWVFFYGAMRFGLSFMREDEIVFAGLRMAQLIALGAMVIAPLGVAYLLLPRRGPSRAERRRVARQSPGQQ
jgi:phosphatidylglycerol---prolipoprotein diacylglyceryl transferase